MMINEEQLKSLMTTFLEENKKLNLSAFRTEEHCWAGNILDSVAFFDAIGKIHDLAEPKRLLDIGTGGGFPLLPLAVCSPKTECIGIDSIAKKIDAVRRIADSQHLANVTLIAGRTEELAHNKDYRESFDMVTARAVAPIAVLLEYAVPFLRVGGFCAFWKSSKVADELSESASAQKALHVSFAGTFDYELPDGFGKRLIVFFRKTAKTSEDYPRKTGIPKSKPL